MRIAVTGTPGVGKSTLAKLACDTYGWKLLTVQGLAETHGLIVGHDALDDAHVIDTDALFDILDAEPAAADEGIEIIDGHMAHMLPVDAVWLVRCDPAVLEGRLRARGYRAGKIEENLEAEAMDLVLQEAAEDDMAVVMRDGTRRTPQELLSAFVDAKGNPLNTTDLEPVDWSEWLLR